MRDIVILDLNLYNFLCIYRSVEEKEAETQEARKKKKEKLDKLIEDGYFELDKDSQRVKWTFSRPVDRYVQFIRFPSPSLLQIFIEFVPRSLLEKIIPEFPPGDLLWLYIRTRSISFVYVIGSLYQDPRTSKQTTTKPTKWKAAS